MSMSVGASSNALSYLQSLLTQGTGAANTADPLSELLQTLSGSGATTDQTNSAASSTTGTASSACPPFGASTMAALISLQGQSATGVTAQSPSQLFAKIDTNGDGQISQSEFESALSGTGVSKSDADTLFAKLDANGDDSISQSELASAKSGHGQHHMHGGGGVQGGGSSGQSAADSSSSTDADGTTTQTVTNPDGSTTTTTTYADGSSVEMTTSATSSNGSATPGNGTNAKNSTNLIERLIQMQAQLLNSATSTLSAIA
jgi:hypothetical protein